jgi:uncharacterized protein (TIGR00369 family)
MKKLFNPFRKLPGYNCFGCAPHNEYGLRMEFVDEGEYVTCKWEPGNHFQGYFNVLHGGVIAALLDEIASWAVMSKIKTSGVTSRMDIHYLKPVFLKDGPIMIRAKLKQFRHKIAIIETELFIASGETAARADVSYYIFPEGVAREKYSYPGFEKFYED